MLPFAIVAGVVAGSVYSGWESNAPLFNEMQEMSEMGEVRGEHVSSEKVDAFRSLLADSPSVHGEKPIGFFREHYDAFGPEVMIATLDADPLCHPAAHNLGRVIYERTQDLPKAAAMCQSQCSGGCIHGVLMGMFSERAQTNEFDDGERHAMIDDLTPEFITEIKSMCEESVITRYTGIGNCYHAIGHALMTLANYDIPSGLALCEIFKEKGPGAVYYCATGIYMEREMSLGREDAKVSQTYPCDENLYPAACFRYKLRQVFDLSRDYEKTAAACLALGGANQRGCFHGLGFGAAHAVYRNPSLARTICAAENEDNTRACLEGMFGLLNQHDRSVPGRACESFDAEERPLCDKASTTRNFSMKRDFAFYMDTE